MEGLEQDNWTKSIDWWLTGLPDWFKAGFFLLTILGIIIMQGEKMNFTQDEI